MAWGPWKLVLLGTVLSTEAGGREWSPPHSSLKSHLVEGRVHAEDRREQWRDSQQAAET